MVDVSETGRAGSPRRRNHEDVMFDGVTITPFGKAGGGRWAWAWRDCCLGAGRSHRIALFGGKAWESPGRPARPRVPNAMLSRLCTRLFDAVGWICDLGRCRRVPRAPSEVPEVMCCACKSDVMSPERWLRSRLLCPCRPARCHLLGNGKSRCLSLHVGLSLSFNLGCDIR